jgi:hypothetical protein
MATKTFVGTVGAEGVATGPHLHQYVLDLKTKQYLDPRTFQSPLLDIRVGKNEVPLAIKNAQGQVTINPATGATVTSEFGPRSAPTDGASSQHMGRDIALPHGTPVKYFGAGQYIPVSGVQGFGNLAKIITPDKRYELGFGHMASLGTPVTTEGLPTGAPQNYDQANQRTQDLLEAFMYGTQYREQEKPKSLAASLKDQFTQSLLSQALNSTTGLQMPAGLPEEYSQAIWG